MAVITVRQVGELARAWSFSSFDFDSSDASFLVIRGDGRSISIPQDSITSIEVELTEKEQREAAERDREREREQELSRLRREVDRLGREAVSLKESHALEYDRFVAALNEKDRQLELLDRLLETYRRLIEEREKPPQRRWPRRR